MKMSNEARLGVISMRKNILLQRDPVANKNIVNKINREITRLTGERVKQI